MAGLLEELKGYRALEDHFRPGQPAIHAVQAFEALAACISALHLLVRQSQLYDIVFWTAALDC